MRRARRPEAESGTVPRRIEAPQFGALASAKRTEPSRQLNVSVEGPASFGEPDREKDVRETAIRYLGKQMGEMYLAMIEADPEPSVLVVVKPQRWYSVDYSKLG